MENKTKQPTRIQIVKMAMAIRDAYFLFDIEDYCDYADDRLCGRKCNGCICYKNLVTTYKFSKKFLPKKHGE